MEIRGFDDMELETSIPTSLEDAIATATEILERRRYARIELRLPGRYMLEDLGEFACETLDVSPSGLRLKGSKMGPWGSRVIAYIEGLGRVEGNIVRKSRHWFAISLRTLPFKQERLANKISWLALHNSDDDAERRRTLRVEGDNENVIIRAADGREHLGELVDISVDGASFFIDVALRIDETIRLGAQVAKVVHLFDGGAAVKFI